MFGVITAFAIIFTVIAAGYVLARMRILSTDEQRLTLNRVAFFAATPALVFKVIAESEPEKLFTPVIAVSTTAAILSALLYVLLSRMFFKQDRATTTMGATATGYVNSNNIGLPVGMYALGNAAYVAPLIMVQVVFLSPIVLALITEAHAASRTRQVLKAIMGAVLSPMVIAAAAGVVITLTETTVPDVIWEPVSILGGASIPLVLLAFGASLSSASPLSIPDQRKATLVATAIKTLGMPVIAFLVGVAMGLTPEHLYAAVVLATLPTAQNVYNYAATYRKGEVIARDTILLSTFLALPAMLVVAFLFGK
ncbi:AEC family transporter [Corynebacterium sp. ZY180755]